MLSLVLLAPLAVLSPQEARLPSAEALLARHEAWLGTPEARARVRGLVLRGTIAVPGMEGALGVSGVPSFEERHLRGAQGEEGPVRVLQIGHWGSWGDQVQGTDGVVSWTTDPSFGVSVSEGEKQGPARRLWAIFRSAPWSTMYAGAKTVGAAERDGRAVVELALEPRGGGASERWFLAPDTGELVALGLGLPDPTGDGTLPMEYRFSDWREVDGVRYAHRRVQRVLANAAAGSATMEIVYTVESLAHDAALAPERLDPPANVAAAIADKTKRTPVPPADDPEGCALETVDARPVASIRVVIPADKVSQNLAVLLPEIMGAIGEQGVAPAGPPFTRYHRIDPAKNEIDLEAGIPVRTPVESKGRMKAGELPGGRVARTWHVGSYHELPRSYARLEKWMKEKNATARGPFWEIYWTDPGIELDPRNWHTQILWPVE